MGTTEKETGRHRHLSGLERWTCKAPSERTTPLVLLGSSNKACHIQRISCASSPPRPYARGGCLILALCEERRQAFVHSKTQGRNRSAVAAPRRVHKLSVRGVLRRQIERVENNLSSKVAHSLGIFYNDDQTQHRWAMKYDDPKVLEEIDTVFVTLEPSGGRFSAPTGKPLLEAYFGTPPNHP
jgi:hypothetical protein